MMKRKISILLSTAATLMFLPGCSSIKHTLGMDHYQADEFSVPTQPPLCMPPSYDDLPTPKPGAKGPGEIKHQDQAQEKLLGAKLQPVAGSNDTEKELGAKAGEKIKVEADIREKINQEASSENPVVDGSKSLFERMKDNLSGKTNEAPTPSTSSTKPTK